MLSKCANPACQNTFRYLNEGKVFLADWVGSTQENRENYDACWRRTEMFWLCDACSGTFALSKQGGSIIPIQRSLIKEEDMRLLKEIRISG